MTINEESVLNPSQAFCQKDNSFTKTGGQSASILIGISFISSTVSGKHSALATMLLSGLRMIVTLLLPSELLAITPDESAGSVSISLVVNLTCTLSEEMGTIIGTVTVSLTVIVCGTSVLLAHPDSK